jgi:hypothetical protein
MAVCIRVGCYVIYVEVDVKYYVIERKSEKEYEHMMKIYDWCESTFGPQGHSQQGWSIGWQDNTEDRVRYIFWDESLAVLFTLRWL